jgi:uridylate kinase
MAKSEPPASSTPAYRRIVLKLSGEMLGGSSGHGLETSRLEEFSRELLSVTALGVEVGLVIGGGNIMRGGRPGQGGTLHRATADYMGMLGTIINGLALQDSLESLGADTRLMSAIEARAVCEPYIRRRALRHLQKKRIVILAGGTGHPYFSTDTTAALRATELKAEVLMKATKVDGVYSDDPVTNPQAKRYARLEYLQVLREQLHVMDAAAISLCMENRLPILVFSVQVPGNIRRACLGEGAQIGTLICSE